MQYYKIQRNGVVLNIKRNTIIKQYISEFGYLRVNIYDGVRTKHKSIHRLVAE
jgi:hypothetical protein